LIDGEDVDVGTVARHVSDQCQQFTQFAGVRPFGVALILAGVDGGGDGRLFLTDPSGTYVSYDAVAIGAGSDGVTTFLEKAYSPDIGLDEATRLAAAAIQMSRSELDSGARVRMARVPAGTRSFEIIPDSDVEAIAAEARKAYADRVS
ncbi:MAG: proteasome subunit alpha, partial [Thaumarchaeota archaeon]|nr:proteasome subunit alpha [Nitrososphaerota archaeon]